MIFTCELMADPVVASDGNTYERDSIQLWMKTHDVSPHTNTPFDHKMLVPSLTIRKLIAAWCEENGVPVPVAPKRVVEAAAAGRRRAPQGLVSAAVSWSRRAARISGGKCCRRMRPVFSSGTVAAIRRST